ncbi:hypothetical protein COCNU_02G013710 [Cocos nucifera]|uniref:Uncharacterized protein n=1 Tax=Cocos nucifera TaxID=13894 RepID=A0A8K0HZX6_COCNU|nr:hypothetical protein COCNU_02G013710 [Cocos nucifera]
MLMGYVRKCRLMDNIDNIDHLMSQNELILEAFSNTTNDTTQQAISFEVESQAPSLSVISSKGKKGNGLRFDGEYDVIKKTIYDVAAAIKAVKHIRIQKGNILMRSIGDNWKFGIIPVEGSSVKILVLWDPNLDMVIVVYVSKSVICVIVAYLSSLEVAIWSETTPILVAVMLPLLEHGACCGLLINSGTILCSSALEGRYCGVHFLKHGVDMSAIQVHFALAGSDKKL